MPSDEEIRTMIEKTEELTRQIKNLKAKIKRRQNKLEEMFDPLERQRIEIEIELLKKKILGLQLEESKISLSIIGGIIKFKQEKSLMNRFDWSKAGKA